MIHMEPTTHEVTKDAAPRSSPMANPPEFDLIAENVAKTSGLPFPKARKVTPATFSSSPRICESVPRFGQKKSEALIPRVEKRNTSQIIRPANTKGRTC